MAGIYIHIPYCRKKCFYCDFYSITNFSKRDELIKSIISEIILRKNYLEEEIIETIYFGGGTPSILNNTEINKIYNTIKTNFTLSKDLEFTFEANPDDLTIEYLQKLNKTKINRLSIGIQSFQDADLILMNRRHTAKQAIEVVQNAQKLGFKNISIDLIYGLPNMTAEKWQTNINKALKLNIQHISAYHLSYETGTKFFKLLQKKIIREVSETESINEFEMLINLTEKKDFIHYEISNFCKENFYSKHNSNYWNNKKYLGIGPSAHSYNLCSRQWNIANVNKYISGVMKGKDFYTIENLSENDKYNEYIITKLRTMWGVDMNYLKNTFDIYYVEHFSKNIEKYITTKHLKLDSSSIKLTNEGKFISDKIIEDLLYP